MTKAKLFNKDYQKQQSDKYRYKHIHTDEYCTFEAYIAELIVLRRAERLNLERPGYKFWTKGDPNHWLWMKQLNATRALVKKYSEKAVLAAVKSKDFERYLLIGLQNGRGWKINPSFEKIVDKYQKIVEKEEAAREKETTVKVVKDPVRRTARPKKNNVLTRLRGINGGKREK